MKPNDRSAASTFSLIESSIVASIPATLFGGSFRYGRGPHRFADPKRAREGLPSKKVFAVQDGCTHFRHLQTNSRQTWLCRHRCVVCAQKCLFARGFLPRKFDGIASDVMLSANAPASLRIKWHSVAPRDNPVSHLSFPPCQLCTGRKRRLARVQAGVSRPPLRPALATGFACVLAQRQRP